MFEIRICLLCFCAFLPVVSGQDENILFSFDNNQTEIHSNQTDFLVEQELNQLQSRAAAVDPLRRCDLTFYDLEFYFTSPNYPQPYSNNLDCVVIVKRSRDVCRLRLFFDAFEVQTSDGCLSDFLQIDDQTRLCGTLPSKTSREYSFTGSELRMRFRTDAFGTAPGFFVRGQQVPCGPNVDGGGSYYGQCDVIVDQPQFDISNRNWPLDVPLDCTFTIRKLNRNICTLHLIFVALNLNCQFEYLDIGQRRFCSQPKDQFQVVDFLGTEFVIRFHSDRTDLNSRLSIRVIQRMCRRPTAPTVPAPLPPLLPPLVVPSKAVATVCLLNPDDGGTTTSARNFLLRSPSYPTNTECVYVVRKNTPDVCSLTILFQEFSLDSTPNCDFNFLAIGNEKLCGSLPQGSVRVFEFLSNEIPIRFVFDPIRAGRGFALSVTQRSCKQILPSVSPPMIPIPSGGFNCDAFYTTGSFVFWSTPVPPSFICTYTVSKTGSEICSLQLYFQVFDFGLSDPSCSRSFLDVKGDRLCDRSVEGTTRTYSFDGSNIQISYQSSYGPSKFRIAALQRPCRIDPPTPIDSCERGAPNVVTERRFRIGSSGHLARYVDCVYVVRKSSPRVCQLRLHFIYFDLESSDRCINEFLQINGIKFCGNQNAGTKKSFDFVGSELYIRFHIRRSKKSISDYGWRPRGFLVEGDQLECYAPSLPPPQPLLPPPPLPSCCCNRTFSSCEVALTVRLTDSKSFSSPSYCVYTIRKYRPDICNIEVEFVLFQLPTSNGGLYCEDHFLEIGGRRHCGSIPSGTIKRYEFPNEVFNLAYWSRGFGGQFFDSGGFSIRIRQIPCLELPVNLIQRNDPYSAELKTVSEFLDPSPPFGGCDVVYDETSFYWSSPNFPQSYSNNVDCALTIRKTNPNVCRLFVAFRYFDVEFSENCSKDYLQITLERFCGHISTPYERFFTFSGDSTVLNFRSDKSDSKLGFSIYVEQESCDHSPRINRNSTLN